MSTPEQVGERIGVDVPASSDFVGADATGIQQVVYVLARAGEVGHRVCDSEDGWQFLGFGSHRRAFNTGIRNRNPKTRVRRRSTARTLWSKGRSGR